MADEAVLELANKQNRLLITFDKDFAEFAFRFRQPAKGIILLRFVPRSAEDVAEKIQALLSRGVELENHFATVAEDRVRVLPLRQR